MNKVRMTQLRAVYEYMMNGNRVDRSIALAVFGAQNLMARISELHQLGVEYTKDFYYHGDTRIASYRMNAKQRAFNDEFFTLADIRAIKNGA